MSKTWSYSLYVKVIEGSLSMNFISCFSQLMTLAWFVLLTWTVHRNLCLLNHMPVLPYFWCRTISESLLRGLCGHPRSHSPLMVFSAAGSHPRNLGSDPWLRNCSWLTHFTHLLGLWEPSWVRKRAACLRSLRAKGSNTLILGFFLSWWSPQPPKKEHSKEISET